MIIYRVFCKNYDLRKVELVAVLAERRNDLRGKTRLESASRWAKLMFGQLVRDKHAIFVVPDELNFGKNTTRLVEKMVFNKEEVSFLCPTVHNNHLSLNRDNLQ